MPGKEQRHFEGRLDARNATFAIVASKFNETIVSALIEGARGTLRQFGVEDDRVWTVRVPGAFEIPAVAHRLARSGKFDGIICLGAVIRGATPHFDYVAGESAKGIARAALESPVPLVYGILTTETIEQAVERSGTKAGNRGSDAAMACIELVDLARQLDRAIKPKQP